MAQVPYSAGVPSAAPQTGVPDDSQHLTPAAAQGGEALGQGLSQAGQFYGQVAADDGFNNFLSGAMKLAYGDPDHPNADGTPNTGYFGLKGADAMRAAPGFNDNLDALEKTVRGQMPTPESQLQFDTFSRRYRASLSADSGRFLDQQSTAWSSDVNATSGKNAIDGIALNPTDPTSVANFTSDLINSRVKQAQMMGAQPGDPVYNNAVATGKADAAKAQILAVGATDPARALGMANDYKSLLGVDYPGIVKPLQDKADKATGEAFVVGHNQTAIPAAQAAFAASPSNPTNPVYQQVTSSIPGGMSAGGLARLVQIESGGKDVTNKFGYTGYAQFGKSEWATYGAGGDPHNFTDSVAAAQRYAIANGQQLSTFLGRQPTDAELYLAHQQGAGGAKKLLAVPNAPAAQAIGYNAVYNNLPTPLRGEAGTITSQQFVSYWTRKFNGTAPANDVGPSQGASQPSARADLNPASAPWDQSATGSLPTDQPVPLAPEAPQGATPPDGGVQAPTTDTPSAEVTTPAAVAATGAPAAATPLAAQFQAIGDAVASGKLTEAQGAYAYKAAEDQARIQAIADNQTAAQMKAQNEQAQNEYVSAIMQGKIPPLDQIANDNRLTSDGKKAMSDFILKSADTNVAASSVAYGPGYWKAYQQVLADPGDPSRVADPTDVLKMVGQGLTPLGAQKLMGVMSEIKKPDQAAVQQTMKSLIAYAKSKLSFQQDPSMMAAGVPPLKDPQGEQLFNAQFIPQFEAAYSQAAAKGLPMLGKNGFLSQENVDAMVQQMRNPREMALSRLEAQNGVNAAAPILAPPIGADPTAWQDVLSIPALSKGGAPWPAQNWAAAVHRLWENPDKATQEAFDAHFSNAQFTASQLLGILRPGGVTDDQERATRQMDAGAMKEQDLGPIVAAEEAARVASAAPNPNAAAGHVR